MNKDNDNKSGEILWPTMPKITRAVILQIGQELIWKDDHWEDKEGNTVIVEFGAQHG